MRHRRQLCNRQLEELGIRPTATWQVGGLQPGDVVRLLIVAEEAVPRAITVTVTHVMHHGHYIVAHAVCKTDGQAVEFRLPVERPDEWGVVSCRLVTRSNTQLHPSRWRR